MAMNATMFETLTDRLTGRVQAAITTPAPEMLSANTEEGLAAYIDEGSEDPLFQAAMLPLAANVDRQVLAPNVRAYLDSMLNNSTWKAFLQGLNAYVISENGGSHATFAAWLNSESATAHPLAAELIYAALGEAAFGMTDAIVGAMHPYMKLISFDRVFVGTMGALADDTADAASVAVGDVAIFIADDDIVAFGSRHRFNRIFVELGTLASQDAEMHAYYWNGADYVELSLTDHTTGLSVNGGLIEWTMPADWVPANNDMQGTPARFHADFEEELYYVILQRQSDAMVTPPIATWFQMIPEAITDSAGRLYGVDQPPLAFVRITAQNEATIVAVQDAQYDRFVPPGVGNNELKLVALTKFAQNITFTLPYTDENGVASTKAQAAWNAAIAAGDTHNLTLDTDTGVRAVTPGAATIATDNTAGIFAVIMDAYSRSIGAK